MIWTLDDMRTLDLEFNTGFTNRELARDVELANRASASPEVMRACFAQYALEQDAETAEADRNDR